MNEPVQREDPAAACGAHQPASQVSKPAATALPLSLDDYAARAAQVLDENARAYVDGGAGDEHSLRANRRAWADWTLRPRVLRDLSQAHTRVELLGQNLDHPLLLAPVAHQRLFHPDAEFASALAAAAQGAGYVLSAQASVPLEQVANLVRHEAGRGPLWFQLVLPHDRGFTRALLARVASAGFEALVLTVDAPINGVRDRERRAGFRLPSGIRAVNLDGLPPHPAQAADGGGVFERWMASAARWRDLGWLLEQTHLPVLLKGVLHSEDACMAIEHGVSGLIVSNHGGRTLDGAMATADALGPIVQAVAGRVPVLVDGGIRRGVDVLRACALGARAVLLGRPQVHALACAGAAGVAHMIRLLRDELETAMALCGCASLDESHSVLAPTVRHAHADWNLPSR